MQIKIKLSTLSQSMTMSERENTKETFYHFTDTAPQALKDVYTSITDFSLNDTDYNAFYDALNWISDNTTEEDLQNDDYYPEIGDVASVYTADLLDILTPYTLSDIEDIIKEYQTINTLNIEQACAIYYERKVTEYANAIINNYLKA